MVKKKVKTTKKVKKRAQSWTQEDVQASTGLPPLVEGQLRCYLKLCVSQILWVVPSPPEVTHVRVKWWGEDGEGTIFKPVDVKKGRNQTSQSTARYAIRSGPKQFASYLSDMASLHLEVLSGPMRVPVGRAQVDKIGLLAPSRPINGFFPVFSADEEKVADLQVAVSLESIMASYDSMSSITVPTPDMSFEMFPPMADSRPVNPPRVVPMAPPRPLYSSTDDPFASPVAPKSGRSTPRGVDAHLYAPNPLRDSVQSRTSQKTTSGASEPRSKSSPNDGYPRDSQESTLKGISTLESQIADQLPIGRSGLEAYREAYSRRELEPLAAQTYSQGSGVTISGKSTDLVSVLLDRGNKLREAMIKSTVPQTTEVNSDVDTSSIQIFSPLKRKGSTGSTGDLFKEILKGTPDMDSRDKGPLVTESQEFSDLEGRALDLVLGPDVTQSQIKHLTALTNGSPASSISGDDVHSDLDNPLHDEQILQELFYKDVSEESDVSLSDPETPRVRRAYSNSSLASLEDPGNRRPPSRRSSASSIHLDHEPTRDDDFIPTPKKKTRKGSKKAKKGMRRGHASGTDASDSDGMNFSRLSETSKVSFDPVPSDAEETSAVRKRGRDAPVEGMSVERLTLLGRVHVARVVIDSLMLMGEEPNLEATPTKPKGKVAGKGKPPRPSQKPRKTCTYFVEYNFPVVATSRDKYQPNAMATEVMRVASKKVADGAVSFGHRSVFPVLFDGDSIEKWWKSALVFKVYSRTPGQKVPKMMGMCTVPLKSVLKSETLFLDKVLEVKDRSQGGQSSKSSNTTSNSSFRHSDWPVVGNLRINIELASDSRDFSTALAKTRLAEMSNPKIVPIPKPQPKPPILNGQDFDEPRRDRPLKSTGLSQASTMATQTEPRPTEVDALPLIPGPKPRPVYPQQRSPRVTQNMAQYTADISEPYESMTLHTLLMIPEGQNITLHGVPSLRHGDKNPSHPPQASMGWTGRDLATRNLYLVCRMFWCDDVVRSNICWGTHDPDFKFVQVAPVLLTASLLERLRDNFMVVEVWDKKTTSENDQLVGIVKLPLHQFYMSYRDRKIAVALLRSQYPVVSVDTELPIVSPFSGTQFGQLHITLAMGSTEQISSLQRLKIDKGSAVAVAERPTHYLERHQVYSDGRNPQDYADSSMEHVFEVSVEGIKGLKLLDNMIWGEADCFIQYHFPAQTQTKQQGGPNILHAVPSLKTFRTATTLCVPDPVFNDVIRHKLVLPEGTPVQREILTACAGAGGGAGGVPFEVWCRYYHPNVRDQVIAKGMLPLAKLCAMVTMQKRGEPSVQTFSLPLSSLVPESDKEDPEMAAKLPETGLLEVTVNYKTHIMKAETEVHPDAVSRCLPGATVCISVGVVRASGLKAAATALAKHDNGMQYASQVGVNSYARVMLSFLKKEDERMTRTIARTFAPEFSYFMDFPCPLLWTEPDSDALSLAEILENSEATFELWHQAPGTRIDLDKQYVNSGNSEIQGRHLVSLSGDILLGTVTVPLQTLLTHKTGLSGWFSINLPTIGWDSNALDQSGDGRHGNRGLERVVGGLELSIKFAHHEDLERVVHAARGVGWAPDFNVEHRDWDSADEFCDHYHHVNVSVDLACFPVHNALMVGQNRLDSAAHCYVRYKFYDKGAVCSKMSAVEENEEGYIECTLQHNKSLVIPGSSPFSWYLREERLEVQVWVTYHPEDEEREKKRPRHRDKLIGSAYLDLATLADSRRRQHRISGVYPLFKPGASSLGGACIRAHVSLKPHSGGYVGSSEDEDETVQVKKPKKSPASPSKHKQRQTGEQGAVLEDSFVMDTEGTFSVHISIERAFHLPEVVEKGEKRPPNCYVSYQTADTRTPTHTDILPSSTNPAWNHEHDTRLDKQVLVLGPRTLVFKVWHKPVNVSQTPDKSTDKVLGFVSVDMAPLTAGFHQLCGWYNIMDFNGQCQGQIKVSLTPQEVLLGLDQVAANQLGSGAIGTGGQLPSHLAWFPDHLDAAATVPGSLPHFQEHFVNVKKHHEHLQSTMHQLGVADPNLASRSILFNNLRSNMQELDDITSKLKQKLTVSHIPADYSSVPMTTQPQTDSVTMTTAHTQPHSDLGAIATSSRTVPMDTVNMAPQFMQPEEGLAPQTVAIAAEQRMTAGALDSQTLPAFVNTPGRRPQLHSAPAHFVSSPLHKPPPQHKPPVASNKPETEVSIYTQTLQNAQNLLQTINHQADVMSSAAQTLSGSGQSLTGPGHRSDLGQAAPQNGIDSFQHGANLNLPVYSSDHLVHNEQQLQDHVDRSAHDVDVLDGGVAGYGEDDDDTFDQVWKRYDKDQLSSNLPSDVSDIEEADIVLPKPLNDVSSANFCNGVVANNLQDETPISETAHADDSFFGIPVPKAVASDSVASYAAPDAADSGPGSGILEAERKLAYGAQDNALNAHHFDSEASEHQESGPEDALGDFQRYSQSAFHRPATDSDSNSDRLQQPAIIEPELRDEDPTSLKRVSRTSLNSDRSPSPRSQSGRQAAMFRREYQRHRAGSSSSEAEEDAESRSGPRRRRRKKKTSQPSNRMDHMDHMDHMDQLQVEDFRIEQPEEDGASEGFEAEIQRNGGFESEENRLEPTAVNQVADMRSASSSIGSQYTQELVNGDGGQSSETVSYRSAVSAHSIPSQRDDLELDRDSDTLTPRSQISQQDSVRSHGSGSVRSHQSGSVRSQASARSQASGSARSQASGSARSNESGSVRSHHSGSVNAQESRSARSQGSGSGRAAASEKPQMSMQSAGMPNFFLPPKDLEQTMRALRTTALPSDPLAEEAEDTKGGSTSAKTMMEKPSVASRFASLSNAKSRAPPSSQQTNRIAKIFAQRFTS